jgi:hypothetical protein
VVCSPGLIVALLQKPKRLAHDLARGLIEAAPDLLVYEVFEFRRQRDIHQTRNRRGMITEIIYLRLFPLIIAILCQSLLSTGRRLEGRVDTNAGNEQLRGCCCTDGGGPVGRADVVGIYG